MDKNSLRKLIADKLGISSSKKEFAFDFFLKKLSGALEADEALSVPGIGYFQLKNEPLLKQERKGTRGQKKLTKRTIFFSPAGGKEESSLFLSFDIDPPQRDFTEFDENIFSLGIQKPVIPIFDEDDNLASLQKSLESRIEEVIHKSEKIHDFNLFDNYINLQQEEETEEVENKIMQSEEIPPQNITADFEAEEIKLPEPLIEDFEEVSKEKQAEENIKETFEGKETIEEKIAEIPKDSGQEKNPFDELDGMKFGDEEINVKEEKIIPEKKEETAVPHQKHVPSFEEIFENDDDILESVAPDPNKNSVELNVVIEEDEESIEWDWGDELNAEFQEEPEQQPGIETVNENEHEEDLELEPDLSGIEDEIADINIDDEDLNLDEQPGEDFEHRIEAAKTLGGNIDKEINEEEFEEKLKEEPKEEIKEKKRPSFKSYDWKKHSYGKSFWIVLAVFILFTIFGLYYLLFWGGEKENKNEVKDMPLIDTTVTEDGLAEQIAAKVDTTAVGSTVTEPPLQEPIKAGVVETQPEEEKTLYRKFENETRINSRIYSDGKRYMVQVSSFKSTRRAESDAARLQAKGLDAFIVEAYLPQLGGTWYRVRIGYFATQKEAEEFLSKNNL